MTLRNAAHAGRCVVPPLLLQQEGLVDEDVRPLLPLFVDEAMILQQRFDARFRVSALERIAIGVIPETDRLADCFVDELQALARPRCVAQSR
jgi:hypothetical protein